MYVIDAADLEPLFSRFTQLYSPVQPGVNVPPEADALDFGEQLAALIQDHWRTFSERLTESNKQHDLLHEIFTANCREEEILDAPEVRDLWTDRNWLHTSLLDRWWEIAEDLKHPEQREPIGIDAAPSEDDLLTATDPLQWFEEDVARASTTLPTRSNVFRARLGYREEGYRTVAISPAHMGVAPPKDVKRPGRANPEGVSYFYAAQDEETAVAENRPHRGALVSVAMGQTLRELRLIDLATGMRLVSPFECAGECLASLVESCELFNHLNEEFAKPLRHTDDTHEYRPTQFFAEWARDHGYDGLRYGSAMHQGGSNFVIFDAGVVAIRSVRLVRVDVVEVKYSDYRGEDR